MGVDRRLLEALAAWRDSKAVILGVGNILKGDDAAGPLVCERLSGGGLSAVVIDAGTAPENYVRPILNAEPDVLLIVDAVDFGGPKGEIRIFEPAEIRRFAFSTHALSLHLFVDRLEQERPLTAHLIGIQAGPRRLGDALSSAVHEATEALAETLAALFQPPPQS